MDLVPLIEHQTVDQQWGGNSFYVTFMSYAAIWYTHSVKTDCHLLWVVTSS